MEDWIMEDHVRMSSKLLAVTPDVKFKRHGNNRKRLSRDAMSTLQKHVILVFFAHKHKEAGSKTKRSVNDCNG